MKQRFAALSVLAALLVMASLAGTALAQDTTKDTMPAVPRFGHLTPHLTNDNKTPATPLTTWNGSFVYKSHTYNYNMVGTAPSTGTSTTIKTFVIPIALKYVSGGKTTIFSPKTKQSNGATALQNMTNSPIFQNMDFVSPGGTNLGTTQYEDAFQRGNFWGTVSGATGYHVLLGTPTVLPMQILTVPAADGSIQTEFGITVGTADINWFDGQLQSILTKFASHITPSTLPIFMTYDSYLTEGGCCIGGYHNSFGSSAAPQAYAHYTYIGTPGIFSQDVSALSHEVGEWLDDPLVVNTGGNPVVCGILEVGDPEEGFSNYGAFPYTLNGFTYNLQDLVFLEYFGAPNTTSVDGGTESFHDNPFHLGICNNGG
jgi:hypothetical protein